MRGLWQIIFTGPAAGFAFSLRGHSMSRGVAQSAQAIPPRPSVPIRERLHPASPVKIQAHSHSILYVTVLNYHNKFSFNAFRLEVLYGLAYLFTAHFFELFRKLSCYNDF